MDRRRGLTLATCCGAHAVQDGLTALLYVLLPVLAQAFGLTYAQVGVTRAASSSAMMFFEIPSGILSERIGERILLVFGLLCSGAGFLALTLAGSYVGVVAALVLAGGGAAFQHSLSSAIISKTFEGGRMRPALGAYNSSGDIGKLTFSAVFTLAIGFGISWQVAVAGLGSVAIITAIALFSVLNHLSVGARPMAATHKSHTKVWRDWGISDRTGFLALIVIVLLDTAVQAGFLTFLAFVIIEKQISANLAAFAVVLTLAGGVLGKFGCGFLAERLGLIRSLVLIECLTAAGIVTMLKATVLGAFILLPLVGAVLQGSSTITYGMVGDFTRSDRRSRGFAAIYSISTTAAILAPIALGFIGDHFGLSTVMMTLACVTLLPLLPCITLSRSLTAQGIR